MHNLNMICKEDNNIDKVLDIMNVDGVDYVILKDVKNVGTTYVFLSNVANSEDMMIRKSVNDEDYVPLDGHKEFELACLLLFK